MCCLFWYSVVFCLCFMFGFFQSFSKFSHNKLFYTLFNISLNEGEFLPPFISCVIAYMFCHHQKGGDCWPKRLHSLFIYVLMITKHIKAIWY